MTTTIAQPTRRLTTSNPLVNKPLRPFVPRRGMDYVAPHRLQFSKMSDNELVECTRNGHRDAFGELVKRYQTKVKSLALKITKNENDAQEVTQEVFLNAYAKLDSFKGTAAFSSWLYRVAANGALMLLRSRKKDTCELWEGGAMQVEPSTQTQSDWSIQADRIMERKQLAELLSRELSELPERYRTILALRELEGLSNRAIADTLELSVAAVKSRLHRARIVMRKRIIQQQKEEMYCC